MGNSTILRTIRVGIGPGAGGAGGGVQKIEWDGTVSWDFRYNSHGVLNHHDVRVLPNGNILLIAWEMKTRSQAIAAGRNPDLVSTSGFYPDHIIEVQPTGPTAGAIVWEWHVWDHLIQDFDSTKENYGLVALHPELVDINYGTWDDSDWMHTNSIDYNEQFDQIMISVCYFNEIWIIDHSTTTEEAAGHTGGTSGKGGDLLYRWGNPAAYRRGTADDQKFFHQHDATWIDEGFPGEGNILVFNNGRQRPGVDYSSVDELVPPVNEQGEYDLQLGAAYGPAEQAWIYAGDPPESFYYFQLSGAERLIDGNTLICMGSGTFFEITPTGDLVWSYENPYPTLNLNDVFKIAYIPPDDEIPNQPPQTPDPPIGQAYGKVGQAYTYTTRTTDPNGDEVYYLWLWSDGNNSGWLGPYNSGAVINATHTFSNRGSYSIKVKAKDTYGLESDWSDPFVFRTPKLFNSSPINNILTRIFDFLKFYIVSDIQVSYSVW
jgi:hypothetical protein